MKNTLQLLIVFLFLCFLIWPILENRAKNVQNFIVFFGVWEAMKIAFEINWPLEHTNMHSVYDGESNIWNYLTNLVNLRDWGHKSWNLHSVELNQRSMLVSSEYLLLA